MLGVLAEVMRKAKTKFVSLYEFFMENKLLSLFLIGLFCIFLWDYKVGLLLLFGLFLLLLFIATIFADDEDAFDEIFGDFWSFYFFREGYKGLWLYYYLSREENKKKQKDKFKKKNSIGDS
jgi:hypothetical protein